MVFFWEQKSQLFFKFFKTSEYKLPVQPTNDLDVLTVEQLEALLQDWPGSLVLASHDRSLLDRVAGRLLVLQGDQAVRLFDGSYAEVLLPDRQISRLPFTCS